MCALELVCVCLVRCVTVRILGYFFLYGMFVFWVVYVPLDVFAFVGVGEFLQLCVCVHKKRPLWEQGGQKGLKV